MRRLTNIQFIQKLHTLFGNSYTPLEAYLNRRTRIKTKCNKCFHVWSPMAHTLLNGFGCPICGLEKARKAIKWNISQQEFLNKIPLIFRKKIVILGKYKSQHGRIKVKCRRCKRIWESTPCYLYKSYGCDSCYRKYKGLIHRKSHADFVAQVCKAHDDKIKVIGKYTTGENRVKMKCLQCGNMWEPVARNALRRGCAKCISSKGENKIERILKENHISYISQYGFNDLKGKYGGQLRFDFAVIKNRKLSHLIEYDGKQHFFPIKYMGGKRRFDIGKQNDKIKDLYCIKKKIKLIRIPYTKFNKLDIEMLMR